MEKAREEEAGKEKINRKRKGSDTRVLARIALISALSFTLSLFTVPVLIFGGSVSLMMIPLIVLALVAAPWEAALAGLITGFLKILINAKIFGVMQALLDYPIAYGVLGIAGMTQNIFLGTMIACLLRYGIHVVSGLIYFNSSFVISMTYNASHMLPETIITLIVLVFMHKKKVLERFRKITGN